jgi:hypothetical protein
MIATLANMPPVEREAYRRRQALLRIDEALMAVPKVRAAMVRISEARRAYEAADSTPEESDRLEAFHDRCFDLVDDTGDDNLRILLEAGAAALGEQWRRRTMFSGEGTNAD